MPFKKYPPVLRAEDNFRLTLFPNHRECLWNAAAENKIPRAWSKNSTKNEHCHSRKLFNDHMDILNNAFLNDDSPFELKYTEAEGIGVFCKKDISISEFNKEKYRDLLIGFTMDVVEGSTQFSEAQFLIKKHRLGRPPKEGNQTKKVYSLYGPISFVNHACQSKHATFNMWKDSHNDENIYLKMKKNLKKGAEVTISYGTDRNLGVRCKYCKKK